MVEPLRAKAAREQQEIQLLTEIRDLLKGAPPPPPPPPPTGFPTLAEIRDTILEALEKHGVLKRANDFYVATIDLATARNTPTEITELANALSLTIFRNTGTFTLYLQKNDDTHKITVDALTYPQTLLIDWFDIQKVWITNTAQTGYTATILKFFRT
jgi:hypothetical protein